MGQVLGTWSQLGQRGVRGEIKRRFREVSSVYKEKRYKARVHLEILLWDESDNHLLKLQLKKIHYLLLELGLLSSFFIFVFDVIMCQNQPEGGQRQKEGWATLKLGGQFDPSVNQLNAPMTLG